MTFKLVLLVGWGIWFTHLVIADQADFAAVFVRKRARIKDLEMASRLPIEREEHEMF